MKKIGLALIVTISMVQFSMAQEYKVALGVKGGYPVVGSFDVKYFFAGLNAVEARIGGSPNEVYIQGLYERNFVIGHGFEWYFGLGGHVGFWTYRPGQLGYYYDGDYYDSGAYTGFDALGGCEYTFEKFPLNLSADLGPVFDVAPYVRVGFGGNIAARFAIGRN